MNVRLITADQLTADQIAAWTEIQRSDAALAGPYFHPEFTRAVAAVRGDVEIGAIEDGGRPAGFFPFQRGPGDTALPVGGKLSDFQGLIAPRDFRWDPRELLRGCRLAAWRFDHLIASQAPAAPFLWRVDPSPYIDLSKGWEAYRAEQLARHRDWFNRLQRKHRQAVREAGPLRVELDTADPAVFGRMIRWKRRQYRSTGATDVLAFDWTVALLERVRAAKGEGFAGVTSALYMGGVLTAVLFSIRSHGILHAWFSAYDPDFAPLSPGIVFWLELLMQFPRIGIKRIDLGKGPEEYKTKLMTAAVDVAEGAVDPRPLAGPLRRHCRRAIDWTRQSRLRNPLLKSGRFIRRLIEARSLRR